MGYIGSEQHRENGLRGSKLAAQLAREQKALRVQLYSSSPKVCEAGCGVVFTYERRKNRFCSRACAASVNNRLRAPEQAAKPQKVAKAPLTREQRSEIQKKVQRQRSLERNTRELALWKSGQLNPTSKVARRLLIFDQGAKCSICGWEEVNPHSETIPVEMEHMDGDCYNNLYTNVCFLCPNHHALTPTFRGLNARKGRGRKLYKLVSQWAKERKLSLG